MWKKLLKYRNIAKDFSKVDIRNGERSSFWYDDWSTMGRLIDVVGERGQIDMGISKHKTLAEAWDGRSSRTHRAAILNNIEQELYW